MSIKFYIQNAGWVALNPIDARNANKAMNEYRKTHKVCEVTGNNKGVQIHHIVPVWADPSLAADPNNLIALSTSANIHLIFGHNGNFGQKYIKNIKQIAKDVQIALNGAKVVIRPKKSTFNVLSTSFWGSIYKRIVKHFISH